MWLSLKWASVVVPMQPMSCNRWSVESQHWDLITCVCWAILCRKLRAKKPESSKLACPLFTVEQRADAAATLRDKATATKTPLTTVRPSASRLLPLGVAGEHQYGNAALATALASSFFASTGRSALLAGSAQLESFVQVANAPFDATERAVELELSDAALPVGAARALRECRWPGRSQLLSDPVCDNVRFALDGAHTVESMGAAARWFASTSPDAPTTRRVLLFNCAVGKSSRKLLACLLADAPTFDAVLVSTFRTDADDGYNRSRGEHAWPADAPKSALPCMTWQEELLDAYVELGGGAVVAQTVASTRNAVAEIRSYAATRPNERVDVLVTGSLYLVGAALEALDAADSALNLK
eukprot:TRINITY_DN6167_c0_g1_i1.p1 TRINITY_DN6167_c0_g1~~TRINITY_DN6167_c0_g1_i1.p1  ORF type:complete len:356 (-),score=149.05 TRINITY_DN6167_c0_g1_i1:60-1127(-)